ncbi:ASCH domain-containing protein [Microbacterium sp. NPDC057650]|uniref:ASCH domain-containing protein n=1 Tax=unclassified Microbacterium TaxID=2609290 RepID=UPI00366DD0A3
MDQAQRIERFWRSSGAGVGAATPPAWSFGDSPALADELLELALRGEKTAMASALWEFEAEGDPLPQPGDLAIVLDGAGEPRALIRTTAVVVVPFEEVSAEHASLEGEGDLSLDYWRVEHERAWRGTLAHTRYEFDTRMLVVCERFELLFPAEPRRHGAHGRT